MNLPTHNNNTCWSVFPGRNTNLFSSDISENPEWNFSTLENRTSFSRLYSEQWIRKCVSSSKIPQTLQVQSQILTFGLEYRPRSIARVCEMVLSWATATLYLWFFNMYRYGSITKERLNLLYVLKIGYVYIFCISLSHWILNWVITTFLHSIQKFDGSLVISIPWFMITSFTLVTHLVYPLKCSLFSFLARGWLTSAPLAYQLGVWKLCLSVCVMYVKHISPPSILHRLQPDLDKHDLGRGR